VGSSITIEKMFASVLESLSVHGDSPPRCGAVKFRPAARVEQALDPVEVEEERIAAHAGEESVVAGRDDVRVRPKETPAPSTTFSPSASIERASSPVARNTSNVWAPPFVVSRRS